MSEVTIDKNAPSVRTLWRGTGTGTAVVQSGIVTLTLWVAFTAMYLIVGSRISLESYESVLRIGVFIPTVVLMALLWRQPVTPRFVQRNHRIWPALVMVLNLWPILAVGIYSRSIVPRIARGLVNDQGLSVGIITIVCLFIGGGFLVFRMVSELVNPLNGNAIELITKKWDIAFEKWKIDRDRSLTRAIAERDEALIENRQLRDELKKARSRVRVMQSYGSDKIIRTEDDDDGN